VAWGVLNAAMLVGLLGAAVPVVIHLLNRRRDQVVDWGAMQFLELGHRARQKIRLTELLLLLARMALLAIVALAMARPFWSRSAAANSRDGVARLMGASPPRDVVLVVDASASMGRKLGATTPLAGAVRWAREFVAALRPGDSVAIVLASDRVRPLVEPPSFDKARLDAALAGIKPSRGSSDFPAALAESFQILEKTQNPNRDVVILTDGQRLPWQPGATRRWSLVRDLQRRLPVAPRLWSAAFGTELAPDLPNGSVGPLELSRVIVTPGLPLTVSATLANDGPGPLTRTVELLLDGHVIPGSARVAGPIPAGGKTPLSFRTALPTAGSHLLTIRLAGADDSLPGDDESSAAVDVTGALPVLLVDGEPSLEPLGGEVDFLRAALAPTGDDTPQVRTTTVPIDDFTADSLSGQRVVVLANVERLSAGQTAAIGRFLESGGGLLIAPGDRTEPEAFNNLGFTPAALGLMKGDPGARAGVAHPMPRSFVGPVMAPFAEGDSPVLGEADLFFYRVLGPVPGASVLARLDTEDPWVVERPHARGRVLMLAAPLDAEGGTLPVNPDFVPLAHEWVYHLAGGTSALRSVRPGEPLLFELGSPPPDSTKSLPVLMPDGTLIEAPLVRTQGSVRARVDETAEPGVYRLTLPEPPGGFAYGTVSTDGRESDLARLEPAEAAKLAEGWPLEFSRQPAQLMGRLFETADGGRHEVWRGLIWAALATLCVEIWLTRRLARSQRA
jgi:hypothetical protein